MFQSRKTAEVGNFYSDTEFMHADLFAFSWAPATTPTFYTRMDQWFTKEVYLKISQSIAWRHIAQVLPLCWGAGWQQTNCNHGHWLMLSYFSIYNALVHIKLLQVMIMSSLLIQIEYRQDKTTHRHHITLSLHCLQLDVILCRFYGQLLLVLYLRINQ